MLKKRKKGKSDVEKISIRKMMRSLAAYAVNHNFEEIKFLRLLQLSLCS